MDSLNLKPHKSPNTTLIRFISSVIVLIIISFVLGFSIGKIDKLTCNRVEGKYVICQRDRSYFYGAWSEPPKSFRLTGAAVEEVENKDSEGGTYYTYKLYLNSSNKRIDFHDYGRNFEAAYADTGRIQELLIALGGSFLKLEKRNIWNDFYVKILNIFCLWIYIKIFWNKQY
jgi:hypothetical protein